MEVKLESNVYTSSGRHIGKVGSLVVDYNTKDVMSIIVRSGVFFSTDRIFPVESVERIEPDGAVHLNLSDDEAKGQEEFVERDYTAAKPGDYPYAYTDEAWVSGTGQPSVFWAYGTAPLGYNTDAPFMGQAPMNPPEEEIQTNLPERSVLVNAGTDVVGKGGQKIGTVDEISYSQAGDITGFVVKAGFLFHHDVHIPADWIDEVSGKIVTLKVTADRAQQSIQAS